MDGYDGKNSVKRYVSLHEASVLTEVTTFQRGDSIFECCATRILPARVNQFAVLHICTKQRGYFSYCRYYSLTLVTLTVRSASFFLFQVLFPKRQTAALLGKSIVQSEMNETGYHYTTKPAIILQIAHTNSLLLPYRTVIIQRQGSHFRHFGIVHYVDR